MRELVAHGLQQGAWGISAVLRLQARILCDHLSEVMPNLECGGAMAYQFPYSRAGHASSIQFARGNRRDHPDRHRGWGSPRDHAC